MLMADDRSNLWSSEDFSFNDDEFGGNLSIDMGALLDMLGESPDPQQRKPEHSLLNDMELGSSNLDGVISSIYGMPCSATSSPSNDLEASDLRTGILDGSFEDAAKSVGFDSGKLKSSLQFGSPVHSFSASLTDWMPVQDQGHMDKDKVSRNVSSCSLLHCQQTENQIPDCGDMFSFDARDCDPLADNRDVSKFDCANYGNPFRFTYFEGDHLSKNLSGKQFVEDNKMKVSGVPDMDESSVMAFELPDNRLSAYGDRQLSAAYCSGKVDPSHSAPVQVLPHGFNLKALYNSDDNILSMRPEAVELSTEETSLNNITVFHDRVGKVDKRALEAQMPCNLHREALNADHDAGYDVSSDGLASFSKFRDALPKKQECWIKEGRNDELIGPQDISCHGQKSYDGNVGSSGRRFKPSYTDDLSSKSSENTEVFALEETELVHESKRARLGLNGNDGTASGMPGSAGHDRHLDIGIAEPSGLLSSRIKSEFVHTEVEKESKYNLPTINGTHVSNISSRVFPSGYSAQRRATDDDADVCILEDISGPACLNISAVNGKSLVAAQRTMICDSFNTTAVGRLRLKANDERFVFRAALQGLCQPKSEDNPPDGVLAVSLLRHQRIALSWMVKKEKDVSRCSGGILADDQGLGKTVSTIALILKERSPSSVGSRTLSQPETLNLDEDDDCTSNVRESAQGAKSCQVNGSFCEGTNISVQAKQRPAAGTLIVCPTSVLRQWSEEFQNKVTSKANLSVLVYHGGNRTKDPSELAKYDVVLTTYSIVSMEVPRQPLVDEDDDEMKSASCSPMELASSKKRKYPSSASKKTSKAKKGKEDELLEPLARPLAGVGWFRVVLDEAQSIKNHRTQVARACWGLRAKRRWCLSGTPIQNAVDDLYSYFRFLRFDPYSGYRSFCSGIKVPILKNPPNGYRKLQAVLKTVMLRRTKGTLLDGEPIINLPTKTIKLKKVDFTKEERDFYCRLEADSRAQFAEYAAAGTVKQNYVNILLMLLRLRQACDHPFLVRRSNSSSVQRSSVETAKKLPREEQIHLLNCLEASLAICGICNDPPEDAVVTSCGHVFCNQCICEYLTGDDTNCPTTSCKTHLSTSLVFSVETLRSSLSDQPVENNADCTGFDIPDASEPFSSARSYDSSKIKAALEVLQSLNRRQDCKRMYSSSSVEDGTSVAEITCKLHSGGSYENFQNDENPAVGEVKDSVAPVGEKAIVFSQWTRMLDLLEACLKNSSIQYRRLDGTMSVVARDKAVKDFNTLPEVSVMIMSLKAASLGLNMVAACHVLLLDLWWNPTTEDQAIDRAHRIGQTRPVTVLRLTVKDTVEDRILALQQKKREMVASAFGEDETGSRQTRLTVEDLKYLFMDG